MNKHNFLGFDSISDFLNSLVGYKDACIHFIPAIIFAVTTFITGYIFDSASTVYTLWALILVDWITGVWKSINAKVFVSYRLFRAPIILFTSTLILSLGWHMSKSNVLFYILPSILTGGFMSVFFVSIIENLGQLGFLPKSLVSLLKKKVGLKTLFESDKKKEDDEEKDKFI